MKNQVLPEVYMPFTNSMDVVVQILVRTGPPPLSLLHAIGEKIDALNPDQPIRHNVRDLDQLIASQPEWQREHLVAWLFGAFAAIGLALASVGLYSVVSYTVEQRTSEFGVRMALGAPRSHVLAIVYQSTLLSLSFGISAGVVLTLTLNQLLSRWIGANACDPLVLACGTLLLASVSVLACGFRARYAASVDPVQALRSE